MLGTNPGSATISAGVILGMLLTIHCFAPTIRQSYVDMWSVNKGHLHFYLASNISYTTCVKLNTGNTHCDKISIFYTLIGTILEQLHWLPSDCRIQYKIALLTFKARTTEIPSYLSHLLSSQHDCGYFLRSSLAPLGESALRWDT